MTASETETQEAITRQVQEETMGDGLDSLIRGETQMIKRARGYFWNYVVSYFINLHLNSD